MLARFTAGLAVLAIAAAILPQPVGAQEVLRIAAIVNDDVISILDVQNRLSLVLLESGLKSDQQTQRRLVREVVRQLIDERLRLQEAERVGVRVSERSIDRELATVARKNKMTTERLLGFFREKNIDPITVRARLESELAWQGIVRRQLRRLVEVGEDEIDEELERLQRARDKPQKRVSELFLAVENPDREVEVRQSILRIRGQILEGADFGALARTFSQSASAQDNGDLGWVTDGQFQEIIDKTIQALKPGELSPPIRSLAGLHLFLVREERLPDAGGDPLDARLSLAQITIPVPGDASDAVRTTTRQTLDAVRGGISTCADIKSVAPTIDGAKTTRVDDVRLGDLAPAFRTALLDTQKGETTPALDLGRSIVMVAVCERQSNATNLPSREEILNKIGTERLNLVARRYLRDIRRDAFIDIRI